MRTRLMRLACPVLVVAVLAVTLAGVAQANDPDYQGTYAGTVITHTGRQLPITVYAFDAGNEARLTLAVEGYRIVVSATESWAEGQLRLAPSVPPAYSAILRGDGTVTFAQEGDVWQASGSGAGTALDLYTGSAEGLAQRVAATMDPEAAAAWHAANPIEGGTPPETERPAIVQAFEGAAAVAAPPLQAPLGDPEKIAGLAAIGLVSSIMLGAATLLYGPNFPVKDVVFALTAGIGGK